MTKEEIFYTILYLVFYIGIPSLCWKRWTQEDKEMQKEKEKYRLLCDEADRIINSNQGGV